MNLIRRLLPALAVALTLSGCSSLSSSTPASEGVAMPPHTGKVFVTEDALPANVKHQVIGQVQANARAGYSGGADLYPLLADEARKLGANAVVGVTGGRKVTLLSWAAAYVSGTAIKIEDPAALKALKGQNL